MRNNKHIITSIFCVFLFLMSPNVEAQFWKKLAKTAEKAAEKTVLNKTEEKISKKTGKTIDDTVDGKKEKKSKKNKDKKTAKDASSSNEDPSLESNESASAEFEAYSKFDFVPGQQILAYEDFSQDNIGDLPARWNSSNSAEVVTVNASEGRFIKIGAGSGAYVPEFIDKFPENFTLEYDVIFDFDVSEYAFKRFLSVVFSDVENPGYELQKQWPGKNGFSFAMRGGIGGGGQIDIKKYTEDKQLNLDSKKGIDHLHKDNRGRGVKMHMSIWKQKQRLRIYIDEQKVFDIPKAFEKGKEIRNLRFFSSISPQDTYFYLGNLRYAVGNPDMRNKLITEGKIVTYGITFDSGKSVVKSESYGTLKSIATVLKENPQITVKIIGHTDADGNDETNLELSKQRAEAVKEKLSKDFGINEQRLMTEGRGEKDLLDNENTPEAKAKNRRVEFQKI